jgi:hypothetical protein
MMEEEARAAGDRALDILVIAEMMYAMHRELLQTPTLVVALNTSRAASVAAHNWAEAELERQESGEEKPQSTILRDLFGNPFRPVHSDSRWLTQTVRALVRGVYDDRAFDRLPILADALEDAGCDNADILAHCRQPGEHVRGCWVIDLLLGKS